MLRIASFIFLSCVLVAAIFCGGCKESLPQNALERFIVETSRLDHSTRMDTLYVMAAGEPPYSVYANYLLGNKHYKAATDTALVSGWGDGRVNAQLDSAEIYFNRAIAQDSTFIEAMVNLGSLWDDRAEQLGSRQDREARLDEAIKFNQMALAIDPHDEKARCNVGSIYLRQRKKPLAIAEFQKVLDHNPESALAHYNLAIMFAEAKIYREATREWKLAVKYDPDGDIGQRSRDNIEIVNDLLTAPEPQLGQ